ncbi:hypothetical protein NKG94_06355 [Micromonospora sp. M12]
MAVACGPKVLVADEPTTALDVTVQAGILQVLRDLRDRLGTSVLIITHDLGVIADVADRVVVMYAGGWWNGPRGRPVREPRHRYTAGLLSASPQPGRHAGTDRLTEIPGWCPSCRPNPTRVPSRIGARPPTRGAARPPAPGGHRWRGAPRGLLAPCSTAPQEANR